jgi:class 3 adenylate cyclase
MRGSSVIARLDRMPRTTTARTIRARRARRDRITATLLFGAWPQAAALRDVVRTQLRIYDGDELSLSDTGFVAMFSVPLFAVRCGVAIRDEAGGLGVPARTAVHSGRVELRDGDVCGPAVQVGRRLVDVARPGQLIMTPAVVGLTSNSDLRFTRRGVHRLDGVPGYWRLFSADGDLQRGEGFDDHMERVSAQM